MTLVFIDDPHRLHERMANSGSDETETSLLEIPAHCIAVRGDWCNAPQVPRPPPQHLAIGELPDVVVEGTERRSQVEIGLGIRYEGFDLEPVADDAEIHQQAPAFHGTVAGHFLSIESIEGCAVGFTPAQNGDPA